MDIRKLINDLRRYRGLTKKSCIRILANIFTTECKYDDAGWFKVNKDEYIVVSTDGITEELVSADPWRAGFYSVLVNVNDIVAKGSRPIGFTGVVASNNPETRIKITKGIKRAIDIYGLIILKMHAHPDATVDSVSGTSIGVANEILPSSTAKINEKVVIGIDINGEFGTGGWVKTFDSIQRLNKEEVLKRINAIPQIVEKNLATASRDISVPGILGSIVMLCESSRLGAVVKIEDIPKPANTNLESWLMCYPSFGFILTTNEPGRCIKIFRESGYEANVVGEITKEKQIKIEYLGEQDIFWNLEKESMFGT
ncbi:MAG: AIR synthase-related protein [Candidatus Methylarchaceae archaeon HK01M]|nr:AIR synthase-related protein [Candidatus Methylarchaceae archaeon HK01M]